MHAVVDLTCQLVARASVTPDDGGCQALIADRLQTCGFQIEHLRFGEVDNLWAWHGSTGPTLAFLGHTDVVPAGDLSAWHSDPFRPEIRDGFLYGRGSADMKGSVAAMVVALERFVAAHPGHPGRVGLLLTSDEEGPTNLDGIRQVAARFRREQTRLDWCVVGEPSSREQLGDLIRVGRRGSLSGRLQINGVQGHVAYPQLAVNPVHRFAPVMAALVAEVWDQGNADFPPTSFQISNIAAGTGAGNVIPGQLRVDFNFRFSTASTAESLQRRVEALLQAHELDWSLDWNLSGAPFLAPPGGRLRETVVAVCRDLAGKEVEQSTGGGTSDGRFIAPLGTEVIELGPVNATIHKADECVRLSDLQRLPDLYQAICQRLLLD
ncbi:succinyl-diaminopimelate desuccinylase [Frateuria aurantia]|uniref:Succinyl-diaminopimelate desuccinylase n=1 Tax=Frateuria aurantia (strain ATCC 33424 / DSM 6220 / KCTC 2777 / LMG 1558 / NBRC 3245 / NCIMB 13370) TaxID=767434 RepID=H8KZ99_FRAAD|nr:succinyl-diaminopimelate desuccinylase [Frateuria aurantia]AFC85203.1 succinyl-diaminopimelate desuccinylase [Frateuria aurantia DSM 6220]